MILVLTLGVWVSGLGLQQLSLPARMLGKIECSGFEPIVLRKACLYPPALPTLNPEALNPKLENPKTLNPEP